MTMEDLAAYDVIWDEPLVANVGEYQIQTNRPPNHGGVSLIEAQNLAVASGLTKEEHWMKSGASLRKALEITQALYLNFLPDAALKKLYPALDFSTPARATPQRAMGSGLHQRTFQSLFNVMHVGTTVDQAINTPDFFLPGTDLKTGALTVYLPQDRFPKNVLDDMGYEYREFPSSEVRFSCEGFTKSIHCELQRPQIKSKVDLLCIRI